MRGVFLGIKHSVPHMRAGGGGSIISTASVAAFGGFPDLHAYCAAKAGVVSLTRAASIQLASDRIRVNCIAPGGVSTPMTYGAGANKGLAEQMLEKTQPWPRFGVPVDIANAALFLASDAAGFITGHTMLVDGGFTAGHMTGASRSDEHPPHRQRAFTGPSFEQG